MFRIREEELIIKKHKHKRLLDMFRKTLTKISGLNTRTLETNITARFQPEEFSFELTVFTRGGSNTSLAIYDFWELKDSQKLVDGFIQAIKTDDFEKVRAAQTRV